MPGGRPANIKTKEELQEKWEKYEKECEKTGEYMNLSGFCVSFGGSRWYLQDLEERDSAQFSPTIKLIKDKISQYCIKHAQKSEKNQALNIFLLKNYGYTDKTEQDINVKGTISLDTLLTDAEDDKE